MFTCCYLCFVFIAASQFITGARGQCKGVIEQMNVTKPYTNYLQSPGYGRHDGSDPNSPCQWLLRAEGGGDFLYLYVLAVALDDFTNSPCTYRDRVDIHDGSDENSPLLVTLCGRTSDNDRRFYSSQPLVFINFIFQGSVQVKNSMQGRGFYLQLESVDISQKSTTKRPPNESGSDDGGSTIHMAIGVSVVAVIMIVGASGCIYSCLSKGSSVADSPANSNTQSPAIPSAPTLASTDPHSNTHALNRAHAQEEEGDEITSPRFGGGNTDSSRDGFASSDEISSPRFGGGNTDSSRDGFVSSDGLTDTGCLIVREAPPCYDSVVNGDCRLQLALPGQHSEAIVVSDITPKPE